MRGRRLKCPGLKRDAWEVLKAACQGERDIEVRTRLHGSWLLRSK